MEPQAAEKASKERKFTIKMQEEDAALVKPLFKPTPAARATPAPKAWAVSGGTSYADYVVGQAVASPVAAAQVKHAPAAAAAAVASATSEEATLQDQDESAVPASSTAEDRGSPLNPIPKAGAKHNSIIVSPRQRGNPILKFVRNVPWEFGEVVPDYVLGQSTSALFLSLRYHNLNPNYIHERLRALGKTYLLRVLLLQVDVKDPHQAVKELAKICILADCTLILAWSPEEAGRYLETYKAYEQKPADLLKEKVEQDYLSRVTDCLTSVKSVNRTDTLSLLSTFGSLASIAQASKEDLSLCPGIGPQKAKRLFDILHEPFLKVPK
ncbi:DNA excision repair protein ERCC-1 [Candoia aspera]|uniref:DNA excision repair protein ERCC-1 n=1 Tax=Candoia aspera TaxID=51853 RepID=UPI002FD85651